ncbi:MAG: UGMP family protein, partial [Methanobacteriota archaeon]
MEGKVFLGIESTAHTLGIGIYSEEEGILANVYDTYMGKDGILPREAADHHSRLFAELLSRAFEESRLSIADIDVVAVAQGPGIGAPLSFGVAMARYLASKYGKELVGVNHPYAHIVIVEEASGVNASLVLYVSGGNTQILAKGSDGLFYVLGETLDIGMGNLYDTFMRKAGIRPAHGSKLSEIASKGSFVA